MKLPIRVGLVGVGRWGRTLASAATSCGAVVVAHCRDNPVPAPGLGRLAEWRDLVEKKEVDALFLAAPPGPTTEIALRCAAEGFPVLATKPVVVASPLTHVAPLYIDYVRLWSRCYRALKAYAESSEGVIDVQVEMFGQGPYRNFPGWLDYGPHSLAFVHDLLGLDPMVIRSVRKMQTVGDGEMIDVFGSLGPAEVFLRAGNGAPSGSRKLRVTTLECEELIYDEQPEGTTFSIDGVVVCTAPKGDDIKSFVRNFLEDVETGFINRTTSDLTSVISPELCSILVRSRA